MRLDKQVSLPYLLVRTPRLSTGTVQVPVESSTGTVRVS